MGTTATGAMKSRRHLGEWAVQGSFDCIPLTLLPQPSVPGLPRICRVIIARGHVRRI